MAFPVRNRRILNKRTSLDQVKLLDSTTSNEQSEWLDISNLQNVRVMIFSALVTETVTLYENLDFVSPTTKDENTQFQILNRDRQGKKVQIFELPNTSRRWIMCERGNKTAQVIVWVVGLDKRGVI